MKKVSKILKKIWRNKKVRFLLLGIVVVIAAVISIFCIFNKNTVTELEEIKIREVSDKVSLYLEEVENSNSDEVDKYIAFALEYSYGEEGKTSLKPKEVRAIVEKYFNVDYKEREYNEIGITPLLLDKHVFFNPEKEEYEISKGKLSNAEIAEISIYKYEIDKIEKNKKNDFVVTYNKYVVTNPYEVLNYYNDKNMDEVISKDSNDSKNNSKETKKENKKKSKKKDDTIDIYNYLTGKGKIIDMKKRITGDALDKVAKKVGIVKINYVIKDGKVLVDSIDTQDVENKKK